MTIAVTMPAKRFSTWRFLQEGFGGFLDDNCLTRGAAIAFYAVTAMAPVLFIATTVAGAFLGPKAASGAVRYGLEQVMSADAADLVQFAIVHVRGVHHSVLGSLIGFFALIFTASGVFTEIEDALNVVWKAPRTESYWHQVVRGRVMSLALVVCLGVLLMFSMIFAGAVGVIGEVVGTHTRLSHLVLGIINIGISFVLVSALFAALYKILPNKALDWRDVMVGALGTGVMFEIGQAMITLYLSRVIYANVYGAAAGVIVLLVWVYYAAQIFLLGAEFTRAWATHFGSIQDEPALPKREPMRRRVKRPSHS